MPLFSIIVPFYQGTQTDEELDRCIESIGQQNPHLYELLVIHDGPFLRDVKYPVKATMVRHNDWGHSLRTEGMKDATGDYIIHLNADNILYPEVLNDLAPTVMERKDPVYILGLVMNGTRLLEEDGKRKLMRTGDGEESVILPGIPKAGSIDAMQLIMKRSLWKKYGWWYDTSENSDGIMYERFCKEHPPIFVKLLLGEHN